MNPPANIVAGRILLAPAALAPDPIWLVYERLDGGEVAHARYVGILPYHDGESADDLCRRAEVLARGEE